jgi:hypothetical protein
MLTILFYFRPSVRVNVCILLSLLTVKQKFPFMPVGSTNGRNLLQGICTRSPVVAVTTIDFMLASYKFSHSMYDS